MVKKISLDEGVLKYILSLIPEKDKDRYEMEVSYYKKVYSSFGFKENSLNLERQLGESGLAALTRDMIARKLAEGRYKDALELVKNHKPFMHKELEYLDLVLRNGYHLR